jgi:uncharacterized protein (TIGR00255 family)
MTGYGRGAAQRGPVKVTVELRSVNHRFLDLKLRTSNVPAALEDAVTSRVRERLERGAITVSIRVERTAAGGGFRIDRKVAAIVHRELTALAAQLTLSAPNLGDVLGQPGVVIVDAPVDDNPADAEAAEQAAAAAASDALDALVAMRDVEGATLAKDLAARIAGLVAIVDQVAVAGERAAGGALERLRERVARLCEPELAATIDQARLAQEIAILADRADVTEELVRARAHRDQLAAAAAAAPGTAPGRGPVGRRLDFLTQELGRELNTLGSKSTAPAIGPLVVDAKAQLEKIREQVQNLE